VTKPNYGAFTLLGHPTLERSGPVIVDRGKDLCLRRCRTQISRGHSGLWNAILGFDHPRLIEARSAPMPACLPIAFFGRVCPAALN
jgi:hypothetical protein